MSAPLELDENRHAALDDDDRVRGRASPLRRAAGVHDPDVVAPLDLGSVRVTVCDHVTAPERRAQPWVAAGPRPGVVHQPDPDPFRLDDDPLGQLLEKRGLVDVPVNGRDGGERLQGLEHPCGGEVADVQDEVGRSEDLDAGIRKTARAAGKMRIAEERDQPTSPRKRPSR